MQTVFFEKEIVFDFIEDYLETQKCCISILTDSDFKKIVSSKIGWRNSAELEIFSPLELREWMSKRYEVRLSHYATQDDNRTFVFKKRKKRFLLF